MSIFHKLTLEILKKNKIRTMVTIIGIILSASMFTAVTTIVSSLQNYMLQNAIYQYGDWHVSAAEVDKTFFDFLENPQTDLENEKKPAYFTKSKVESYVYSQQIGYAVAEGCENAYKPYIYLIGADTNFCENMPVHLTAGRLPQNDSEILLPDHLAENGEVHHKLGDIMTLELGNRVSDGYILGQYNPYMYTDAGDAEEGSDITTDPQREYLDIEQSRTFTVVGFYERPSFENYSAPGYTAITVMDKVRTENSLYNVYFKLENPQDAMEWFADLDVGASYNTDVLLYLGVSGYQGFYIVLYGLAAIIIGLIMFGSISLIYNAFSISVSERTKQFGLLSSIGATKKQLRGMVIFEALFVSAIGIPIGILAGVGGIGITLYFLGKEFSSLTSYTIPLTMHIQPWAVIAACAITLSTVLISVWIPAKRATRVTAVEAIRQSNDIKLSKKERKRMKKSNASADLEQQIDIESMGQNKTTLGERLTYRFFGMPGLIGNKYYKRSKKKYRATVISLFMSIVLFVSTSSFTSYLTDMVEVGFEGVQYDISYYYEPEAYMSDEEIANGDFSNVLTQEELAAEFKDLEEVTASTYVKPKTIRLDIKNEFLNEEYVKWCAEKNQMYGIETKEGYTEISLRIIFLEDAVFEKFLEEHKLNKEMYMNPENPLAVVFDGNTEFDSNLEKYVSYKVFKDADTRVELTQAIEGVTLKTGEIFYEKPYYIEDAFPATLVYPYSMKEMMVSEEKDTGYHYIQSSNHLKTSEEMRTILKENGLSKNYLYDIRKNMEDNKNLVMIVDVFSYGFIILISLIAAVNVFNTISTNINLRRREFAMLKSVGMSQKEINRMMNFECILYGSRALLYGIPVSIAITWLIYNIVSEGYTAGFYVPFTAIGVAICSVFIVVFATMLYAMRKIKADNLMDALKNENL